MTAAPRVACLPAAPLSRKPLQVPEDRRLCVPALRRVCPCVRRAVMRSMYVVCNCPQTATAACCESVSRLVRRFALAKRALTSSCRAYQDAESLHRTQYQALACVGEFVGLREQQLRELIGRQGAVEIKSLQLIAGMGTQKLGLLPRFNSQRNNASIPVMRPLPISVCVRGTRTPQLASRQTGPPEEWSARYSARPGHIQYAEQDLFDRVLSERDHAALLRRSEQLRDRPACADQMLYLRRACQ